MNIEQLRYAVTIAECGHFGRAAARCCVTQPTLSMMVKKLEEELGIVMFERSGRPITPTPEGRALLERARRIMDGVAHLKEYAAELRDDVAGQLRLAVIPTLAPFLLPLFLPRFARNAPHIHLTVKEAPTAEIVALLKSGQIDMGLAATPLLDAHIIEHKLFYEEFLLYVAESEHIGRRKKLTPAEVSERRLWLVEEGHCLRNQVVNLCDLRKAGAHADALQYEAGSIETLIRLVDHSTGVTVIPKLAARALTPEQHGRLREFADPCPVREISLVVAETFPRKKLLERVKEEILKSLPPASPRRISSLLALGTEERAARKKGTVVLSSALRVV